MSTFKADVPEIAYRFHVKTPRPSFHQGADLSVVWYRGVDNVLWCVRRGISIVCQCNTHSAVEPLVRALFLGDCIPGIVADFIEERGEGEPWLLRLLRDDPDWYDSVPKTDSHELMREVAEQFGTRGASRWFRTLDAQISRQTYGGPVSISGTTE